MAQPPDYTLPFVREDEGAFVLAVRVVPGSSRDRILGVHGDSLRVAVSAPPERGKANAALVALFVRELGLKRSAVAIESGQGSRDKKVRVGSISREELVRRLQERLAATGR